MIKFIGNSLSPMKVDSSILVVRYDFPSSVETNISNSNKLVSKFNISTNNAKINEWVAPRSKRTLAYGEWNWTIHVTTSEDARAS